jgi:hypothetical protein
MSMRRRHGLHQSCPTRRLLLVTISLAAGRYAALTSASGDGPPSPCWTPARTGARSSPGSAPDSRLHREQAETNTSGTGDSPHVQADPSEGARPCMSNGASWWQQNRCRRKGKQAQCVKRPRSSIDFGRGRELVQQCGSSPNALAGTLPAADRAAGLANLAVATRRPIPAQFTPQGAPGR